MTTKSTHSIFYKLEMTYVKHKNLISLPSSSLYLGGCVFHFAFSSLSSFVLKILFHSFSFHFSPYQISIIHHFTVPVDLVFPQIIMVSVKQSKDAIFCSNNSNHHCDSRLQIHKHTHTLPPCLPATPWLKHRAGEQRQITST